MKISHDLMQFKKVFFAWGREKQLQFLNNLSDKEFLELRYCTDFWLMPHQIIDGEDWDYCLFMGGRGAGKSKAGTGWMAKQIENHTPINGRHDLYAMIGPTVDDIRTTIIPEFMGFFPPHQKPHFNGQSNMITCHNKAQIKVYSAETEIRGFNAVKVYCDELAKWQNADETFSVMEFMVRLDNPQIVITTTPKKEIKLLHDLFKKYEDGYSSVKLLTGSMYDNPYLADKFKKKIEDKYSGTRLGRQEMDGELLTDEEDALFTIKNIHSNRVDKAPALSMIVVFVDPAGTANPDSDETGIVVCGAANGHGYLLEDISGRYSPRQWGELAVQMYQKWGANYIGAETNFGGDMVENTIKSINSHVPFKQIRASRGKLVRAEPVSSKYAQNKIHHVGDPRQFTKLETQMIHFVGKASDKKRKDDRLDALVFAMTELLINPNMVRRAIPDRDY